MIEGNGNETRSGKESRTREVADSTAARKGAAPASSAVKFGKLAGDRLRSKRRREREATAGATTDIPATDLRMSASTAQVLRAATWLVLAVDICFGALAYLILLRAGGALAVGNTPWIAAVGGVGIHAVIAILLLRGAGR